MEPVRADGGLIAARMTVGPERMAMDPQRFDRLSRGWLQRRHRRSVVLAALGAVLASTPTFERTQARDACRTEGRRCRKGHRCCGTCRRGRCRSTLAGTCRTAGDACNGGAAGCQCWPRLDGSLFCGNRFGICARCVSDDDCTPFTQPGSACVPEPCLGMSSTLCIGPCPDR